MPTLRPRVTASSATPAPVTPPPMTRMSSSWPVVVLASSASRAVVRTVVLLAPVTAPRATRHRPSPTVASRCRPSDITSLYYAYVEQTRKHDARMCTGGVMLTNGEHDVKEIFLVSESSTSYGKDLGDLRLLETILPELAKVDGIERVRMSYLQPAEIRMDLLDVMASTPGVVPYFDISFQHASESLLRTMRRFGSREAFLELIDQVRARAPLAGIRSNVIVGFPGETEHDLAELESFLTDARLDVVGVFG